MSTKSSRLPGKVLAAFTFNSLASNALMILNMYYLLFFYTDVLLIPPEAATVIFTIARFWDVINDPMMGVICDRTRSKEGKSRFWMRRVAIPGGVFLALSYFCPNWATPAKILWAGAMYILQGMAQTAISIPTNALIVTITSDRNERVLIGQLSAIPSTLANVLIPALTLPFASMFPSMGTGFFILAAIIGVLYITGILAVQHVTKGMDPDTSHAEFVDNNSKKKMSIFAMVKAGFQNKYSTLVLLANVSYMLLSGMMGSTLIYYMRYYVGNEGLMGTYSSALAVGMVLSILVMGFVAKKIGNANSVILGAALCLVAFVPRIITGDKVAWVFAICIAVMGFGSGLISNMAMQCRNDAITYSQLQGKDISGILISLYTFAQKLGNAVSSVIAAGLLAFVNYTPGEKPTEQAIHLFYAENILVPIGIALLVVVFMLAVSRMERKLVKDMAAADSQQAG